MKPVAPFLRTPYNYDTNQAGDDSGLECKDKSLAQQHMKDEVDINNIVKRYTQTGELPTRNLPPIQTDFGQVGSFQQALDLVIQAREAFQAMPAEVRTRFGNDPGRFVDFCSNEQNRDEMRKMGLWSPEANAAFDLKAQTQRDLDAANAAAAEELRTLKGSKKGDTK